MDETSRGYDNDFSYLPVHWLFHCEGSCSGVDGGPDGGPGDISWLAVHRELAVHASDTLVTEHGLLLVIVTAVHDEL
jgi:hypothetical protein